MHPNSTNRKVYVKTCDLCGEPFEIRDYNRKRMYCSRTCASRAQYAHVHHPVNACKKCGKVIKPRWPSEKRAYCSRACSDSVNKNPEAKFITKTCPNCDKDFTRPDWKSRYPVAYCSVRCSKIHAAETVVGENHPLWKPKTVMPCVVCGKTREVRPSLVSRFRVCSRHCLGTHSARIRVRRSKLEETMAEMFLDAGLDFERERKFWRYRADFAFESARLVVECDGAYWHSRPSVQRSDARKDAYLAEHGWRVLRLTEEEIKASPGACTELVLHAIDPSLAETTQDED